MTSAMRGLSLGVTVAALLAGAGCGGGSDGTTGTATPATSATPAKPATPAAEAAELSTLDDIPTTDELEQKMTETVTDQNADAEFEKLQQELEAEDGG